MGKASALLLFLLSFGFFVVTYNLLTLILHNRSGLSNSDGTPLLDPLVQMPHRTSPAPFHVALTATDAPYNKWQCLIGISRRNVSLVLIWVALLTFCIPVIPITRWMRYLRLWLILFPQVLISYVLMAEPDHIFVNPLPNLAVGGYPAAFPFFYITPEKFENIVRKYYPVEKGPVSNIDPIGNSPVIISKESLEKIAPTWMNVSLTMKNDPDTDKAFGWVLEMYGYAVASALHGVRHILRKDFMLQPPWDLSTKGKFIIHYTYGCDYNMKGELTYGKIGEWRFDKRSHLRGPPPRNISMPPHGVPESVVTLCEDG